MSDTMSMNDKGQEEQLHSIKVTDVRKQDGDFVLEKTIFSNIFEKDIRRVFIYKKAERLAKAMHLVAPAFTASPPLQSRINAAAIGLVDAAILPPPHSRAALSRELLTLSSVLSIARSSGLLSPMNAELIGREVQLLLQEIAAYEEPRLSLPESQSFSELAHQALRAIGTRPQAQKPPREHKGHPEIQSRTSRREAILDVLKSKGQAYIKDISSAIRGVSEKTIQRELQVLIGEGRAGRRGQRRWTLYFLVPG